MKKNILFSAFLLCIVVFFSCEKEPIDQFELNSSPSNFITKRLAGNPIKVTKREDGQYLWMGDVILTDSQLASDDKGAKSFGITEEFKKWENNTVYYSLIEFPVFRRYLIINAIYEWETKTDLKFIESDTAKDRIVFVEPADANICQSFFGKIGGAQRIYLGTACGTIGSATHEIGHAVGLLHEHSRPDRDKYVIPNLDNVEPKQRYNYDIYTPGKGQLLTPTLDYQSVMIYASNFFAIDPNIPTLTKLDGSLIPYNEILSEGDIAGIKVLYPPVDQTPTPIDPQPTGLPVAQTLTPGSIISLRGTNGKFVSSQNGIGGMTCVRDTNEGWWEQFEVVQADQGRISLKSRGNFDENNGKFVSSEQENGQIVTCNRTTNDGWWEQFEVIKADQGRISLKATNNLFVSSENGLKPMTCNRETNEGWWEQFTVVVVEQP